MTDVLKRLAGLKKLVLSPTDGVESDQLDQWLADTFDILENALSRSTPSMESLRVLADEIEGGQGPIFRGAISRRLRTILDASPASEPEMKLPRMVPDIYFEHDADEPEPAQGWRPIAEAPADAEILLFIPHTEVHVIGRMRPDGNWHTCWDHDLLPPPSHFQPLPAPPIAAPGETT